MMTGSEFEPSETVRKRMLLLADATKPGGILYRLALSVADIPHGVVLTPDEVADIIQPRKRADEPSAPRYQRIDNASAEIKTAAAARSEELMALAKDLGMAQDVSVSDEQLERIDPLDAVWLIEDGANRTSVVRKAVQRVAMFKFYDESTMSRKTVYQAGSRRPIAPQIPDKNGGMKDNPEYRVAYEIADYYLPPVGTVFDSYMLNVAALQQAGYTVQDVRVEPGTESVTVLTKSGEPRVVAFKPALPDGKTGWGTTEDAIRALSQMSSCGGLDGRQLVIATNGQYRPKVELQADRFRMQHPELQMRPAVGLGDEPGFVSPHDGREINTAPRADMAYVNEMVTLLRIGNK